MTEQAEGRRNNWQSRRDSGSKPCRSKAPLRDVMLGTVSQKSDRHCRPRDHKVDLNETNFKQPKTQLGTPHILFVKMQVSLTTNARLNIKSPTIFIRTKYLE
jgi:hypothetical protein